MDLLRFITAGSVDDGKSTLIGRLLHDSKSILEDQLEAIRAASIKRGSMELDLALLTDGLRAEREQGITIDVAYRYFTTPKRKFVIADFPGHLQYTRNMVTGASSADVAIILVDAVKGMTEQTRRHCLVASLLRIPSLIVCVNKMDLVGYTRDAFEKILAEFSAFVGELEFPQITYIPISALDGDNVVDLSERMPWYEGPALLKFLEEIEPPREPSRLPFRFPIQGVINARSRDGDYRGYMGAISSGKLSVGDELVALPSGTLCRVQAIELGGKPLPKKEALAPLSVTIRLEEKIDLSRGDMLVGIHHPPQISGNLRAILCWMGSAPLDLTKKYALRQTTQDILVKVSQITCKIDINTLSRKTSNSPIQLNDIAEVELHLSKPIYYDRYTSDRATGSFILVDEYSNHSVAAGMIL